MGAAAAHAWGEHETGYGTGNGETSRSKPQSRSGRRKSGKCWAASNTRPRSVFGTSSKPQYLRPAAISDTSWGQTVPVC